MLGQLHFPAKEMIFTIMIACGARLGNEAVLRQRAISGAYISLWTSPPIYRLTELEELWRTRSGAFLVLSRPT